MTKMARPNWSRICVGCGQARHKKELLRIVKCQDDHLEIDFEQNKPGRGAYICSDIKCAELAKTKNGFQRSFRVEVEHSFYDQLIQGIKQIEH